uniref:Uncharacterized protein n=1 Tax=Rhodnius prolixus TaxID=13249 RepID=T1HX34_RHOPR
MILNLVFCKQFFLALAIACVVAVEEVERVKKQVLVGGIGYPYGIGYRSIAGIAGIYPYSGIYGSYII